MVDELDLHRQSVSTGLRMVDGHQLNVLVAERPGTFTTHGFLRQGFVEDLVLLAEWAVVVVVVVVEALVLQRRQPRVRPALGGEELLVKPVGWLLLVADKLARPAPRVDQKEVSPRHLDPMALLNKDAAVVGDIEGQDGQQVTRVGNLLDNAVERPELKARG